MVEPAGPPLPVSRHPVIVVAIPAYNEERHIAETIASLKAQTWGDFLAVISDNASTDRTEEICRREIAGDARFQFIRHEQNQGAVANFNYVYDATDSPYFMWLGAHDMIAPDFLHDHICALEADPRPSLSYSLTEWVDEAGKPFAVVNPSGLDGIRGASIIRFVKSIRRIVECTAINNVIRRSALGPERFSNIPSSDHILLSALLASGPAHLIAKPQYKRRVVGHQRDGYMQRMTGARAPARNTSLTVAQYLASFDRLTIGRPAARVLRPWVWLLLQGTFRRRETIGRFLKR